jgi:hypothetical protein
MSTPPTSVENTILGGTPVAGSGAPGDDAIVLEAAGIPSTAPADFNPEVYENGTSTYVSGTPAYWKQNLDMTSSAGVDAIDQNDSTSIVAKAAMAKNFLVADTARLVSLSTAIDALNEVHAKLALSTSPEKKAQELELVKADIELERQTANLELMNFKRQSNRLTSEAVIAQMAKDIALSATVASSEKKTFVDFPKEL